MPSKEKVILKMMISYLVPQWSNENINAETSCNIVSTIKLVPNKFPKTVKNVATTNTPVWLYEDSC